MEISIIFTQNELHILWKALNIGVIHEEDERKSKEMNELMKKIEMIAMLQKNPKP